MVSESWATLMSSWICLNSGRKAIASWWAICQSRITDTGSGRVGGDEPRAILGGQADDVAQMPLRFEHAGAAPGAPAQRFEPLGAEEMVLLLDHGQVGVPQAARRLLVLGDQPGMMGLLDAVLPAVQLPVGAVEVPVRLLDLEHELVQSALEFELGLHMADAREHDPGGALLWENGLR